MTNRTPDRQDNFRHRPWPVSPTEYPLAGPSSGPVYVPPHTLAKNASLTTKIAIVLVFVLVCTVST